MRSLVCGFVLLALCPRPASAQDTTDQQLWMQVLATIRLSDNWRLHLEEWPRFSADADGAFQVITRAAVGRVLSRRATLWGGYAWVAKPPGPGIAHEHRAWQQLSATFPDAGRWTPSLRVRLEQRFQDSWTDSSHRLRTMGRFVRPITGDRRWSFATWDEFFVTFDETEGGPWQGVDQNRLFAGLNRRLNAKAAFEFGYLWTTTDPPTRPRAHAHVAFLWLNLTL